MKNQILNLCKVPLLYPTTRCAYIMNLLIHIFFTQETDGKDDITDASRQRRNENST